MTPDARTRTFTWHDPMTGAQAARSLSGLDYLAAMSRGEYPLPPLMYTLGFDHLPPTVEPGKVTFYLEPQEYLTTPSARCTAACLPPCSTRPWAARCILPCQRAWATPRWS